VYSRPKSPVHLLICSVTRELLEINQAPCRLNDCYSFVNLVAPQLGNIPQHITHLMAGFKSHSRSSKNIQGFVFQKCLCARSE
jgi:hypothetical protein